jgi:hypothetical protein
MFAVKFLIDMDGHDLDRLALRLPDVYEKEVDDAFLKGKQQKRVKARRLFCYWAVRELGMSLTEPFSCINKMAKRD